MSNYFESCPPEILISLCQFMLAKDILSFGRTCRKYYELTRDQNLWKFVGGRDFGDTFSHGPRNEGGAKRGMIDANEAIMSINTINDNFNKIINLRQDIITHMEIMGSTLYFLGRDEMSRFYDHNYKIDIRDEEITESLTKRLDNLKDLLIDEAEQVIWDKGPLELYKKFYEDSKFTSTCIYTFRRGRKTGLCCGEPSAFGSNYCRSCIDKSRN